MSELIESSPREDNNPLDIALAIHAAITESRIKLKAIAAALCRPGMWISLPDMKRVFRPQVVTLTQEDIQRGAPFFTSMVYGPIPEHKESERE